MSSPGIAFPGFWLLGSLLCLSCATSMVVYNNRTPAALSTCLTISKQLMKEASESLNQFKNTMKSCALESLHIPNPNNERTLQSACVTGQSKTSCMNCMKTIHNILASYEGQLKYSKSYGSPKLLNTVNDMMQALNINKKTIGEASDKPDSFSSQMKWCKFLHIFQQLTETIDRSLNFQNSPEPIPNC